MKQLCAALLAFLLASAAQAQQVVNPLPNAGAYGAYNSSSPTCVSGTGCWLQTDINGNLKITGTVTSSIAGTTSNASSGVATSSTNVPTVSYNYLWNGTTWDQAPGTAANGGFVQGSVASGSADAGNGVKIAGVQMTTPPTLTNGQRGDAQMTANGSLRVAISSGTGGSANNVNLATPNTDGLSSGSTALFTENFGTVYNGTSWDRQRGTAANGTFVSPGGFSFNHITTAATTTAKSGAGSVHTICVNTLGTVASTITVYDNTAGSGTVIAVINSLALLGCQTYDVAFATGLTLVTTGTVAPDVTVSWR